MTDPQPSPILNGGNSFRPQKRVFLGLLTLTVLIFTLLLGLLWYGDVSSETQEAGSADVAVCGQ